MTTRATPPNHSVLHQRALRQKVRQEGFALVEALLSLTILAIAGTVLMRSFQNAIETSGRVREIAEIVHITEKKLHELELEYDGQPARDARLGELRGTYTEDGVNDYVWRATVDLDREYEAFVITVTTLHSDGYMPTRRRRSYRDDSYDGFTLKTIVPAARINEVLLFGGQPSRRGDPGRGGDRRSSNRGSRGSRGSR